MELELHVRGGEEQRPFLRVPIIFVEFLENTFVFLDEMKLGASFEHKYCSIV